MRCRIAPPLYQIIDFPDAEGPLEFEYDPEWLAVLRATHGLMSLQRRAAPLPRDAPPPSEAEMEEVGFIVCWVRPVGVEGSWSGMLPWQRLDPSLHLLSSC